MQTSIELIPANTASPSREGGREAEAHVLVCVGGDATDPELIRQGWVLAQRLGAKFTLLHAFSLGEGEQHRRMIARDRAYARALQAPLVELPAYSPADGIVEYARTRGVTHLVLSDGGGAPWYSTRQMALPEQLARRLDGVDLYVVLDLPK